jgi:hypothetical protein
MLGNIIVLLIVGVMVAGAIAKIIIDKRNGVKCSGCPCSKDCSGKSICSVQPPFDLDKNYQVMKCDDIQNSRVG